MNIGIMFNVDMLRAKRLTFFPKNGLQRKSSAKKSCAGKLKVAELFRGGHEGKQQADDLKQP